MVIGRRRVLGMAGILLAGLASSQGRAFAQGSPVGGLSPHQLEKEEGGIGMKGYWIIFGSEVTDAAAQQEYGRLWKPIAQKYGATIKSLDGGVLKEARETQRVLAVEFDSLAKAQACYSDPAYVEAMVFAHKASHRELIIIEGELA